MQYSQFHFLDRLSKEDKAEYMKNTVSQIGVHSEIGRLRKVLVHTPGREVELMTPSNISELLYNDIIYHKNIVRGHAQLKALLSLTSQVLEVRECLVWVLNVPEAREKLLNEILQCQGALHLKSELSELPSEQLAATLMTGLPLKRNTLELWLSKKTFSLVPLPNMYFVRDSSMVVGKRMVSSSMASAVRVSEAIVMRALFEYHPDLQGYGLLFDASHDPQLTLEGGDILIVNEDLLLVGMGERTTAKAIDAFVEKFLHMRLEEGRYEPFNLLCVQLPAGRSTIHLDMIFTVANREQAIVYAPHILGRKRVRVVRIRVKADGDRKFKEIDDLFLGLRSVGVRMDPIPCGGDDLLHQQREQWNSGANFFSFAPGKLVSYLHEHTLAACESAGFQILSAKDVIKHPDLIQGDAAVVVTVEGSELSRGGGGPRCMTCPVLRDPV